MPANYPDVQVDGTESPADTLSILKSLNEAFEVNPNIEEFGIILSEKGSNIQEYVSQAADSEAKGREFGNGSILVLDNKLALAIWSLPGILREANHEMRSVGLEAECTFAVVSQFAPLHSRNS